MSGLETRDKARPYRAENWSPGDPLYFRPGQLEVYGEQYVRSLAQLLDDGLAIRRLVEHAGAWCVPCGVGWNTKAVPCWVCGRSTDKGISREVIA